MCTHRSWSVLAGIAILIAGCAQPTGNGSAQSREATAPAPSAPKTMTLAIQTEPKGFLIDYTLETVRIGGIAQPVQVVHNFLAINNGMDIWLPQLAVDLPSIDKGTWTFSSDGGMEVVWKIQPNVKWHDGTPFTADDLVFSGTVCKDAEISCRSRPNLATMAALTAQDPTTLVVRWSKPYVDADQAQGLSPLPKHLLEDVYQTDKPNLTTNPHFSNEFVGLGPYRLTSWEPGAEMDFVRFDDYWRGRPLLDRVIVKFLGDPNTMVASILSGAVDVVLPPAVSVEAALDVKDRWQGTGNQVYVGPNTIMYSLYVQLRPEIARPVNGLTNPAVRRALYQVVDKAQVVEAGFRDAGVTSDSWIPPSSPLRPLLESAIPQYSFDVNRSQQLFAEAGWVRQGDALVYPATGDHFELEIAGAPRQETQRMQSVLRDGFKSVGVEASIYNIPPPLATDNRERSTRPGVVINGTGAPGMFGISMLTTSIPSEQNRWLGSNWPAYSNPRLDQELERLLATVPQAERTPLQRDVLQTVLTDLPLMPVYWDVTPVLALAGVKGIRGGEGSYNTVNFFEWDKQ